MEIKTVVLAALAATSAMTFFSYILSWIFKQCFKEPLLLGLVVETVFKNKNPTVKAITAWTIHYSIGLLFVLAYQIIWANTTLTPDWKSGLIFGFFCGVIAVITWSGLLRIPEKVPEMNKTLYYIQLLIAHFIFAFSAIAVYRIGC